MPEFNSDETQNALVAAINGTLTAETEKENTVAQPQEEAKAIDTKPVGGEADESVLKNVREWLGLDENVKTKDELISTVNSWKQPVKKEQVIIGDDIDPDLLKQNVFFKETKVKDFGLYSRILNVDLNSATDLDKILLKEELDYVANMGESMPESARNKRAEQIKRQYLQHELGEDDDPIDADDKKLGLYNMRTAANKAAESLSSIIEKVNTSTPDPERMKKAYESRMEAWKPAIKSYFDDPSKAKFSVEFKGDDFKNVVSEGKETFSVTYEPPKEDYQKYLHEYYTEISPRFDYSEQENEKIATYIRNRTFIEHKEEILATAIKLAAEQAEKNWVAKQASVDLSNKNANNPDVPVTKMTLEDAAIAALK